MVEKSELLRVPAFADLPDDQLAWFLSHAQELHLKAGETYLRAGDPANAMFVILEGQLEIRGEIGGETVAFAIDAGNVTGALPFSRMKNFTVGGRALVDSRALKFFIRENGSRSEEHTSELQSHLNLVCRLLLEKKKLQT